MNVKRLKLPIIIIMMLALPFALRATVKLRNVNETSIRYITVTQEASDDVAARRAVKCSKRRVMHCVTCNVT